MLVHNILQNNGMKKITNGNLILKPKLVFILFSALFLVFLPACPSGTNGPYDITNDDMLKEGEMNAPPEIERVRPNRGPTSGGTSVEITGQNFQNGIKAFFGIKEATSTEFRNPALVVAVTPPSDPGPVTIRVENPDGQTAELAGGFTYEEGFSVTWCKVDRPSSVTLLTGQESEPFFAIVEVPGITNGEGQGSGVMAQIGFGLDGSVPQTSQEWQWFDATYSSDVDGHQQGDKARDEYSATLTFDREGLYDVAFRFSVDEGGSWTYCDTDPSDFPSYDPEDSSSAEVTIPPQINSCTLLEPLSITVRSGDNTEKIQATLMVSGYTDTTSGAIPFIKGEAGFGPQGSNPSTSSRWQWKRADFDSDVAEQDLYSTRLTAPSESGVYSFTFRFSVDGGNNWTYCDSDGSQNGFSPSLTGQMTVEQTTVSVDWCNLQWPPETWTGPGFPSDPVYGRVYMARASMVGRQKLGIAPQVGDGSRGSDPLSGGWTWIDASYFKDVELTVPDDSDEYIVQITPAVTGEYSYAYRFSTDGGSTWTLCDLDGTGDGFDISDAGYMRVVTTTVTIDWCNTQWPHSTTAPLGGESEMIYGQVYSASGSTSAPGRTYNIIAELGFGPDGTNPSYSPEWRWKRANFNLDVGNNDEFMATLSGFTSTGTFDYAFRFTGDWGTTWVYCDTFGDDFPAYTVSEAGSLTVY